MHGNWYYIAFLIKMRYSYDPRKSPFLRGDFEDSPLKKGGRVGSKTVSHQFEKRYTLFFDN